MRAGLLEACDDRRLFGFPLWPRQRELLAAIDAGPRVHVIAAGRRAGKTTMSAIVGLWDCLLRPELNALVRPGERRHSVAVATNLRQSRLYVRAALSIVEHSPLLRGLVEKATDDEIVFVNGTVLSAFPCTSRGARGWPISSLLFDEAAHMLDSEGNAAAEPLWTSLVPSTAQFGDAARVTVSSTPFGSEGLFAELYAQAANGEFEDALAHHATSAQMNPTLDSAFLSREHARDPDGFRSEYLAEFVGGGGAFLDPERITDAAVLPGELPPCPQGELPTLLNPIAGLDPAFSSDPFGLAIVGRDPADRRRLLLALARAWQPTKRASFEEGRSAQDAVLAEVAGVCLRYGARQVVTDQYAAPAIVDRLRRSGLSVRTVPMSAGSKTQIYGELRARLYAGTLDLYPEPALLAELRRLRTRYSAGAASVVNPRVGGSHGDLAQALAMAVHASQGGGTSPDGAEVYWEGRPLREELGEVRSPYGEMSSELADALFGPIRWDQEF